MTCPRLLATGAWGDAPAGQVTTYGFYSCFSLRRVRGDKRQLAIAHEIPRSRSTRSVNTVDDGKREVVVQSLRSTFSHVCAQFASQTSKRVGADRAYNL